MEEEEETVEKLNEALEYYNKMRCSYQINLFICLDILESNLAKILCLNNYEIATIHKWYLNLWKKDKLSPYIDANVLFKHLKINFTDIFQKFFQIFENRVSIHNFVVFVCIFTFGNADDILRILLSVCGVHSNVAISYHHCVNIIKSMYPNALTDEKLSKWISNQQTSEIISVHEFLSALKASIITDLLEKIKNSIIDIVIGSSNYDAICKRSYYYNTIVYGNENYACDNKRDKDKFTLYTYENCFHKLVRILFTHKPPPLYTEYHYNYGNNNNQIIPISSFDGISPRSEFGNISGSSNQYESVVALIRARYGYSRRHTSTPSKASLRRKTLCSSRHSSRQSKYAVKVNGKINSNADSTKVIHYFSDSINPSSNQIVTENADL